MAEELKNTEKGLPKTGPVTAPSKSFMTAGPTLHYSHSNVLWFWGLSVFVFFLTCYFWKLLLPLPLEIEKGTSFLPDLTSLFQILNFRLAEIVKEPISVYEYPWYIVVLGTLMGLLAVVPVLVSQLLSFRFSIPLLLSIIFVAKLPLLALFVLLSCIAVACRPLRFRSRFISVALCMAPQLIYWAVWGGDRTADPIRWGGSFAPWIYAWLCGLTMAAVVLGVGHFTRYKPGMNWSINLVMLLGAFGIFQHHIGFAELDYHRYIAASNPEDAVEFQTHSISDTLDKVIEDAPLRSRLEGRFYSVDKDFVFRNELKENIHDLLAYNNRWPEWFRRKMPDELKYQTKRQSLMLQCEKFMERWPRNQKRMPTVIYYNAILSEFHPDVRKIVDQELLCFYSDYPFEDNYIIWKELFDSFPESPESMEARWRIAMHHAGNEQFDKAAEYCQTAQSRITELMSKLEAQPEESGSLFAAFGTPSPPTMTSFKLHELQARFRKLQSLLSEENRGADKDAGQRLAEFLRLNPHESNCPAQLDRLLERMPQDDGLRDNVLFAKAVLVDDIPRRLQLLEQLAKQYPQRDAGLQAQYELGLLKIQLWKTIEGSEEVRKKYLLEAYSILSEIKDNQPKSPFAEQAETMLKTLPSLK
ncbi:MAG: hypothetical protein OEV87_11875 [Phycisphaerae bacterium]|nr:hypothetical protein [Phycisphaerae bacterium]